MDSKIISKLMDHLPGQRGRTVNSGTIAKTLNRPVKSRQGNGEDNNKAVYSATATCVLIDWQNMQHADSFKKRSNFGAHTV